MGSGVGCRCTTKDKSNWRVLWYQCNHSAFSGGRRTFSDYSAVTCAACGFTWRTKAKYVKELLKAQGGRELTRAESQNLRNEFLKKQETAQNQSDGKGEV